MSSDSSETPDKIPVKIIKQFRQEWTSKKSPPQISDYLLGVDEKSKPSYLRALLKIDLEMRHHLRFPVSPQIYEELHDEAAKIAAELIQDELDVPEVGTAGPIEKPVPPSSISSEPLPEKIGKYRILGVLGSGGMGVVYKARESGDVKRNVALKVIRSAYLSDQAVARFEAERQALAVMNHNHIARVFDTGKTEEGLPFLAMELIQGKPIVDYCEEKELSLNERLELFMQACEGIQHAHKKGILHRDIKSENILVAQTEKQEDTGSQKPDSHRSFSGNKVNAVAKIIDFGLAKPFDEVNQLTDKTVATKLGQIVGTLETMSPEQARSEAVDTMTDIYSLGVLLYQLVTGDFPLNLRDKALAGALKEIEESDPIRPSVKVQESSEKLKSTVETRKTDSAALISDLKGDLDWITLKALEKNPQQRYETVQAFRQDVQNFVEGSPVNASPRSWKYLIGKSFRKHRSTWIAASLISVAFVASFIVALIAMFMAIDSANEAEKDKMAAIRSAKRATEAEKKAKENARLARVAEEQAIANAEIAEKQRQVAENQKRRIAFENMRTTANLSQYPMWSYINKLKSDQLNDGGELPANADTTYLDSARQLVCKKTSSRRLWQDKSDISHDGKFLVTADRTSLRIRVWDLATKQLLQSIKTHSIADKTSATAIFSQVTSVHFEPNNSSTIFTTGLDGKLKKWNWRESKDVDEFEDTSLKAGENSITTSTVFTDNRRITQVLVAHADGTIKLLSGSDFELQATAQIPPTVVRDMVALPDGQVVIVTTEGKLKLLDKFLQPTAADWLQTTNEKVLCVANCPGTNRFAAGCESGNVFVFDAETPQLQTKIVSLESPNDKVFQTRIQSIDWVDSDHVVAGVGDGIIRKLQISTRQIVGKFVGHKQNIYDVADIRSLNVNAMGNQLVSIGRDTTIKIWDLKSGDLRYSLQGALFPHANSSLDDFVRFCSVPNANQVLIATPGMDSYAKLWNLKSLLPETSYLDFPNKEQIAEDGVRTQSIAASPDGKRFVIAEPNGQLAFWKLDGKSPYKIVDAHDVTNASKNPRIPIVSLIWSEADDKLYSIGQDYRCLIWDTISFSIQQEFHLDDTEKPLRIPGLGSLPEAYQKLLTERTKRSRFDHLFAVLDDQKMATAGRDGYVRIWNSANGTIVKRFSIGNRITCFSASHDLQTLAIGSDNGILTLYDLKNDEVYANVNLDFFASDRLVFGRGAIGNVDKLFAEKLQDEWDRQLLGVCFSPTDNLLAVTAGNGSITLIETASTDILGRGIAFDSDTSFMRQAFPVFNEKGQLFTISADRMIREWNLTKGFDSKVDALELPNNQAVNGASNLVVAQNGTIAISGCGKKGQILVWDSDSDKPRTVASEFQDVTWVEFIPDSNHILFATRNGRIIRYDLDNDRPAFEYTGKPNAKRNYTSSVGVTGEGSKVAVSPNGKIGASVWGSGNQMQIDLFDLKTGKHYSTIPLRRNVEAISFSPDSSRIVFTDELGNFIGVDVLDPKFPIEKISGKGPQFATGLAFLPESRQFVQTGQYYNQRVISIWNDQGIEINPATGIPTTSIEITKRRQQLVGHQLSNIQFGQKARIVNDTCFSPDGRWLVTAGADGNLLIWQIEDGKYTYFNQLPFEKSLDRGRQSKVGDVPQSMGFGASVHHVAFSPDGKFLYAVGITGTVRRFDFDSMIDRVGLSKSEQLTNLEQLIGLRNNGSRTEVIERNHFTKVAE